MKRLQEQRPLIITAPRGDRGDVTRLQHGDIEPLLGAGLFHFVG